MNAADSERIASTFENAGYKPTSKESGADLIVVNMCSVRQAAVDKIYGASQRLIKLKIKNPKLKIILTGCILRSDRRKFEKKFDSVLSAEKLIKRNQKQKNKFSVLIPISTGCDNFCSYCVVPFTRGRLTCRNHEDIIKEAEDAIRNGAKEIWLLGQNVNDYKDKTIDFSKLMQKINEIPGDFWIRFTSPHPKDFSEQLIKTLSECEKFAPYINFPLQSGDDVILKKMNRPYKASHYKKLVGKIRKAVPDVAISTDVIVGFAGETKKQFENTRKLFREIGFDMAYLGKYSKRPGTKAEKMEDSVSKQEKERRWKILNEILKKEALKNNNRMIGKTVKALPEFADKDCLIGKTDNYKTIRFKGKKNLIGKFVSVKVISASPWGLKGKLTTDNRKIIVILGPTASGKSSLAIRLAKKINAEIISADSRQVYKGMDIGTGKVTKKETKGIPHHLLDVASPKTRFTVAEFKSLAEKALKTILNKGKIPIICGGTGFYIQALIDGLIIPEVKPDWELRSCLEKLSTSELFKKLKKLDKNRAKSIDRYNRRRLIRAVEIVIKTKNAVPEIKKNPLPYPVLMLGTKKEKNELKKLIENRLLKRLDQGMIEEIKKLHKNGVSWKRLEEFGLEYRRIALYLQNKLKYEEMIERLQKETEHFAKRQITWFKKDKRIHWIKNYSQAENLVKTFLK